MTWKDEIINLPTILIIVVVIVAANVVQYAISAENKTITGEVVDYELYDDYIELTFDTGDVVKVLFKSGDSSYRGTEVLDFTVNSELIVKLSKHSWWLQPNEDRWDVLQIIKLPGDEL